MRAYIKFKTLKFYRVSVDVTSQSLLTLLADPASRRRAPALRLGPYPISLQPTKAFAH